MENDNILENKAWTKIGKLDINNNFYIERFNVLNNDINDNLYQVDFNYNNEIINKKFSVILNELKKFYFLISLQNNFDSINIELSKKRFYNFESFISFFDCNINSILTNNETKNIELTDELNLYREKKNISKFKIDINSLRKKHNNINKGIKDNNFNIPKELLFTNDQIFNIIIKEIYTINSDLSYKHYIVPENDNPYSLLLRFKFTEGILSDKLKKLKSKFDFDFIEIKLILNNTLYPYYPPKLEYIRPKIDLSLLFNLLNIDLFKLDGWNSTVSLEFIIKKFGEIFNDIILDYIDIESESNANKLISFNDFEYNLINFAVLTKVKPYKKIDINFNVKKLVNDVKGDSKFWNSGVGYGYSGLKVWNINEFIEEKKEKEDNIIKSLSNINENILGNEENLLSSSVLTYIINVLNGSNILFLNKNINLFKVIIEILNKVINISNIKQELINDIFNSMNELSSEVNNFIKNKDLFEGLDDSEKETYLNIHCLYDLYLSRRIISENNIKVDSKNVIDKYNDLVKNNIFDNLEIKKNHSFFDKSEENYNSKTLIRIMSELSSLKKSLPIHWDSSILIRVPEDKIHLLSFVITGPKDTPYHNGVFEFHAMFPNNYPDDPPKVLLETTGGGSVRFNPNLYNSGKVCLSLLGTWGGDSGGGESWNKFSTFLQVLMSIQSLILVENPYFNEPGWEKSMHTKEGKKKSFDYTDNIRLQTIKWGIIDKINNCENEYKNFIINHFIIKKDEILETISSWIKESKSKKAQMEKAFDELKELLNNLVNKK